ncbi:aminotransferase class I/II-fold pyridoxal phosphate-dependent enzyme [Hominisplanchenecus murintestinalis]|uniref:Aminotransferase class I/II-fold pyridoxal phosphate-dependent enzyme n=1 Tax=Hominisplanchenecus murintestinalis TaxID=2941517 RepID=A0AC61R1V9_9FIRM|nr:aminotransferase class I/II-fold pyridoxal phosphate-dependent enzyme [Hominisplanchenecus murintestinalis]TGX99780.1 aminotransferase class I/II-fold pyridoxal phosphate-dependent enzyme [Hominisplanchenecus murintestinalis]
MYTKLVRNYSTDISDIVELTVNHNSCFISSWDKSEQILNIDDKLIEQSIHQQTHKNTYIMSKDMGTLKNKISSYFDRQGLTISKDNMTIVSNGTSAAFISLLQIFKRNATNFLCIGPIYFTYMHLLDMFKKKLYYYDINLFMETNIDFTILQKELIDNNIHCIILIQPFFGSGINLDKSELKKIISLCEEKNIYLLIDYVYGNMDWNSISHIHNPKLIPLITSSKHCLLYESISKRIFLNGMKNAIIFGSSQLINSINIDSEICLGSISYIQESLLYTIYSPENLESVNYFITDILTYASSNYNLLSTLTLGTDVKLCKSTSGYFTLVAIPKTYFQSSEDRDIMKEIYQKANVVTIPHSRYYYKLTNHYCFRVNLVIETNKLLSAVQAILQICSNGRNLL